MTFYGPIFLSSSYKFRSRKNNRVRRKLSSSLVIILLFFSMITLVLPSSNVAAQRDGFEYFVPVPYIQRIDDDMDGYFETARIHYDVDTNVAYAEIKVVCSVYDDETDQLVKEISETYTIFWRVEVTDTYIDYKTSYSGTFNFTLAVYDVIHNKKENGGNDYPVENTTLKVNPYGYRIVPDAIGYDADADGYNDDVKIIVRDSYNYTLQDVEIYIDGEYKGKTAQDGTFLKFNYPRGVHEVDAFYHGEHGNTDFKSEGTGQELSIYADADPFDDDGDGYIDDVLIRAYAYNFYPLPNAQVYIDYYYYGTTNQDGLLYAYNFERGFHYVDIYMRNFWTSTTFYAEGLNQSNVQEYFAWVEASVVSLDNGNLANDIDIYLDVDVEGGKTSNVTVNATLFYENRTVAAESSTNYTAIGYEIEDEHIYFHNVTANLTYNLRCELFDDFGNLEDVWYIWDIVIQISYGMVNVDKFVFDLDDDNHLNDVIFWAHIKDEGYTDANIKVYWESNSTMAHNVNTSLERGYAVIENMQYSNYTWVAYDGDSIEIDNGTFRLYDRNPLRTVQIRVQLHDADRDNFYDDFSIRAYDERDVPDNTVSVMIIDAKNNQTVALGFTSAQTPGGPGRFMVEDLQEGYYRFTATILFGTSESYIISTGWFYSYGNSTESTHNLNAFAVGLDLDSDGYKNDVEITITDRNGQPVMNAIVYFDNDYQNSKTTDQNGITYRTNFTFGWHDVNVVFLGISSSVPTGAQAHTRFFSEGLNYDEYFFWVNFRTINLDNDDHWNDLEIFMDVDVDEDVTVEVSVEVEIHYSSNDTLFAQEMIEFEIFSAVGESNYVFINNLTYNEYFHANLTLKDKDGNIEDYWNKSKILVIPITPLVNIDVFLDQYNDQSVTTNFLSFNAHILDMGIENITIRIYYLSNDTEVAEVTTNIYGDAWVGQQLEDGDYYYIATNSTNHTAEYGEINIGNHSASIYELLRDWDNDNFHDDFSYTGKYYNVTPIGIIQEHINITISIYDLQDNLLDQGNTETVWHFYSYNYTEGYYKFIATYESQRVTNGTFYSYGNGFSNRAPTAIISKPVNNSEWLTTEYINFDGSTSSDPDLDVIDFYWTSNISGPLAYKATSTQKLPEGIHKITLFVDDDHGHNVTDSVTIRVNSPVINVTNQLPTANAGPDQDNVPVNTKVTLDGSGSSDPDGYITEYNWTFVSGPSTPALNDSTYVKPTFTPTTIGTYKWELGVKDNNSEWSVTEDEVIIEVIENQLPIVNISLPIDMAKFNTTDTIFFESNGTYDPDDDTNGNGTIDGSEIDNLTYSWIAAQGNATPVEISTKAYFNISDVNTLLGTGAFIINLTILDTLGANAGTEIEINISNVPPVANITTPEEGEVFNKFTPIYLDGTASEDADNDTTQLYYYWLVEKDGVTKFTFANTSNPVIQEGLEEGDYTITLWVDDSVETDLDLFDRVHNVSTIVNISVENRAPVPKFSMYYPDDAYPNTINLGELAFFNASKSSDPDGERDEANFTYAWDFGDGMTGSGMVVNNSYSGDGEFDVPLTYVVNLTIKDSGSVHNKTAWTNLTIRINRIPEARAGDDIDDASAGEDILLDGSGSYDEDGDILDYQWTFDEENSDKDTIWSTSPYTNVTFDDAGDYIVILNVSDGLGWALQSITITVTKANSAPICVAGGDIKDVEIDEAIFFSGINCSDLDTGDVLTFTWDFGDDSLTKEGINVTHIYSENGEYTVTLNVTDDHGAWANDTLIVTVRPPPAVIELPYDGETLEKIVYITGTTGGNDIDAVEVRIGKYVTENKNSFVAGPWRMATPIDIDDWSEWSFEWDTTKDDDAEYIISVRVTTTYGSTSQMTEIDVIVANGPETTELKVTITNPGNSQTVKKTVTISGTTEGDNIVKVEVQIGNDQWELANNDGGDWSAWSYDWDTTKEIDNRNYQITVQVTDGDGNYKTEIITVKVLNAAATEPDEDEEAESILDTLFPGMATNAQYGILGGIVLLILIILLLVVRSKKKRTRSEKDEEIFKATEEERIEKEKLKTEEEEKKLEMVSKQPVRCPTCKEYSVIEDDGTRPLMIECVHCGAKGFISLKSKGLGAPKLPKDEEEEKPIIRCPKCDEMFTVDDEGGAIECPNCGAKGQLNEKTLEELKKKQKKEKAKPSPSRFISTQPKKNIKCPSCSNQFSIPADAKKIECPSCGVTGSL